MKITREQVSDGLTLLYRGVTFPPYLFAYKVLGRAWIKNELYSDRGHAPSYILFK